MAMQAVPSRYPCFSWNEGLNEILFPEVRGICKRARGPALRTGLKTLMGWRIE